MFFKKKVAVADPVVPEAPAAEEKVGEWGEREKAILYGYVYKAFKLWNQNRPQNAIPESELTHILMGLRMATTSTTPEEALKFYEEKQNERS